MAGRVHAHHPLKLKGAWHAMQMQCMIPINQSSRRHNPQPKVTTPMSPVLHHLSSHRYSVTEIHGVSVYPQTHSATATAHRDWVAIRPRFRGTIAGIFPSPGRASPPDPAAAPSRGLSAAVRPRTQWKLTRDLHGDLHGVSGPAAASIGVRSFVMRSLRSSSLLHYTVRQYCASVAGFFVRSGVTKSQCNSEEQTKLLRAQNRPTWTWSKFMLCTTMRIWIDHTRCVPCGSSSGYRCIA
jgi:hypothetical protein